MSLATPEKMQNFSEKTKKALREVSQTNPQNFNFSSVLEAIEDENFNKSFTGLFKDPLTMEKSKDYTSKLCGAIQSSRKSKSLALDLKSCQAQLEILTTVKPKEEVEDAIVKHDTKVKEKEPQTVSIVSSQVLLTDSSRSCSPPEVQSETERNIEQIQDIAQNLEASLYMKCINELYYHKDLPKEARGHYFHQVGGKTNFAKQCWDIDNHGENEIVYSFVSDEGFKMIKYPVYKYTISNGEIETSLPRNIMKFYDGEKPYYISQFDHIGQYFDSLPVNELTQFINERDLRTTSNSLESKYIKPYENFLDRNNLSKKIQLTTPEEAGYSNDAAKSCIKERMKEYVNIMMFRSHGKVFPYATEINEDIGVSDRSTLRHKYIKTSEEIKASLKKELLPETSSCLTIIEDGDFDDAFQKAYGNRIKNYNDYRKYFIN